MRVPPWTLLAAAALAAVGADGQAFCTANKNCKQMQMLGSDGERNGKDVTCTPFDKLHHNVGDRSEYVATALRAKIVTVPEGLVFTMAASLSRATYALATDGLVYRADLAASNELNFAKALSPAEPVRGLYVVPPVAWNEAEAEMVVVQAGPANINQDTLYFYVWNPQQKKLQPLAGPAYKVTYSQNPEGAMETDGDVTTVLKLKETTAWYHAVLVQRTNDGDIKLRFHYTGYPSQYTVLASLGGENTWSLSAWGKTLPENGPLFSKGWAKYARATANCVFDLQTPKKSGKKLWVDISCTDGTAHTRSWNGFVRTFSECAVGGVDLRVAAASVAGSRDVLYAVSCGTALYKVWGEFKGGVYTLRPALVTNKEYPYTIEAVSFAAEGRVLSLCTYPEKRKVKHVAWHTSRSECAPTFTIGTADRLSDAQRVKVVKEAGLSDAFNTLNKFAKQFWSNPRLTGVCAVSGGLGDTPFTTRVWKRGARVLLPYKRGVFSNQGRKVTPDEVRFGYRHSAISNGGTETFTYYGTGVTELAEYAAALDGIFASTCWDHIKLNWLGRAGFLSARAVATMYGTIPITARDAAQEDISNNDGTKLFDFTASLLFPWFGRGEVASLLPLLVNGKLPDTQTVRGYIASISVTVGQDIQGAQGLKQALYRLWQVRAPVITQGHLTANGFDSLLFILADNPKLLDLLSFKELNAAWLQASLAKNAYTRLHDVLQTKVDGSADDALDVAFKLSQGLSGPLGKGSQARSQLARGGAALLTLRDGETCFSNDAWFVPSTRDNYKIEVSTRSLSSYENSDEFTLGDEVDGAFATRHSLQMLLCEDAGGLLATNSLNPHSRFGPAQEMRWYADRSFAAQMQRGLAALGEQFGNYDASLLRQYDPVADAHNRWRVLVEFNNPPVVVLVPVETTDDPKQIRSSGTSCWSTTDVAFNPQANVDFTYAGPGDYSTGGRTQPSVVMGGSAISVASACAVDVADVRSVGWEWLHRVGRTIAGPGTMNRDTGDQRKNLVLGTDAANTEMLTYEWAFIKVAQSWLTGNAPPNFAYGGPYDALKHKIAAANAKAASQTDYRLQVKTKIQQAVELPPTLQYTVKMRVGDNVHRQLLQKKIALFRGTTPSLLVNVVAFTALDVYDVADAAIQENTGDLFTNLQDTAALGRAAVVAQAAKDVADADTAAVALGLAALGNWAPLADSTVAAELLQALQAHAPEVTAAGGTARQGTTMLRVAGVDVACTVYALLYVRADGTVDSALQLVPPSNVGLVGTVATGCRLTQVRSAGQATNLGFAGTVDLGQLFSFLSGVGFPSLGTLELQGQFYGQRTVKWLTLDANINLLAKLVVTSPAVPAELPLVDAGLRVDLLLKDATKGVRVKASVRRRPLFETAGVATEVFGLLEVPGQVSWDNGNQKLAVTVAGGQDEGGNAVLRLRVGKRAGLFGLPFALDYAVLELAVQGSSVAVAVQGEVLPDKMNVSLGFAGTYSAEGVTLAASVRSLALADTVALAQHVGASTGAVDANNIDAVPSLWDAQPFKLQAASVTVSTVGTPAVHVAASATLFGGRVAVTAGVSAAQVSFTATAEELAFGTAGVTLRAASLRFAFGKKVAPGVAVSADLYLGAGLVASLAGCYGSATGSDYYVSGSATASPAIGLDTVINEVAGMFTSLTGVRYALPDAHAGFSAVTVSRFAVSLAGGATAGDGVCTGPARPNGVSDGFALAVQAALQGVGFELQFAHDSAKQAMTFHGAVSGVQLGAATVGLQLDYTLSAGESTLAASVDVAVAGTTLTLGGHYDSADGYCVWLAKSGKAVDLAQLLALHADKVAAAGNALAAPAVVPQFSIGDVTVSLCSAADEARGLPAGFSVSGVATLFGAKVQLQAVLAADRVVFSGQTLDGETLNVGGVAVSSASVAFEVNRAGTDAEKAKHAVTFTAVTSLGATTIQLSDGTATPALRVRYDAPAGGIGFDAALGFLSDLDGQQAGQQAHTELAAQLAHIRLQWVEAVVPHAGALTFRVGLGFTDADVVAELAVVWGQSVGVAVSAQAGKTVALGAALDGAAPGKVHPGAMSAGVTEHYSSGSGFADFTVALSVTRSGPGSGTFALDVSGRPALGQHKAAKSGFVNALAGFTKEAWLSLAIEVPFGASVANKDVSLQLGVRRGRQNLGTKGNLWIEGFAGGGPGGDAALGQPGVDGTTLKADGKGFEFFVGLTLAKPSVDLAVYVPLKACVRNCKGAEADKQWIWFADSLDVEVSATHASVKNELAMQGGWWKVLGVEWLHLRSALFALEMDLKSPGSPGSLEIGGNMCLGEQAACQVFPTPTGDVIDVYAYTSINVAVPEESWFIVLANELTFGGLFRVLKFDYQKLPQPVLDSGLLALKDCSVPATHDYTKAPPFDQDCYVQVSYNPTPCPPAGPCADQTVSVPGVGTIVVQKGFVVRGVLDILDWKLAVDIEISKKFIKIDLAMLQPLAFKLKHSGKEFELLSIGKTYTKAAGLTGGARLDLQAGADPSTGKEVAQMRFEAAFEMKALKAYGSLLLDVNSKDFTFDAEVSLFAGAFDPRVEAKWDWDGTYLHLAIEDVSFAGVVVVKDFEYEQRVAVGQVSGKFVAKVSVLGFLNLGAELEYSFGVPKSTLSFDLTETSALSFGVHGSAEINEVHLRDSHFTLTMTASIDLAALRDAVVGAIVKVGKALKAAWNAVADGVKKLEKQIGAVLKKGWESFKKGVADVFDAVFGPGAGKELVAAFSKAVEWGKKLAKGVKTFLADTFTNQRDVHIVTLRDPADEYGCLKQQRVWRDCLKIWPLRKVCFPDHGDAFTDPVCLKRAVQAATQARIIKEVRDRKDGVRATSQAANYGTDKVHEKAAKAANPGDLFQEYKPHVAPEVGAPDVEPTRGTYKGKVSVPTGASELRTSAGGDGTLFDSSSAAPPLAPVEVDVNFNPSDKARATAKVADRLSARAQARQEGHSAALDNESGQSTARPTLRFRTAGDAQLTFGCAVFNAATFSPPKPTFRSINPSCKGDVSVGLAGQSVAASCGRVVYTNSYIGHDACGYVSDELAQTVTVEPQTGIAFDASYPFDACDGLGKCTTDPIHAHGRPKLQEACQPHTMDYVDGAHTPVVPGGGVESCWQFVRTWTAELAYTQDGTPEGASCGNALTATKAQTIFMCNGDDAFSTVRLRGDASGTPLGLIWRPNTTVDWWYVEQTTDMSLAGGAEGQWQETTITPTKRVFRNIRGNCYLGVRSMFVTAGYVPSQLAYARLESPSQAEVRWQADGVLTCLKQPTVWDATYQPETNTFLLSVRDGSDALHVAPVVAPALYGVDAQTTPSVFAGTRRTATDPAQLHGQARADFEKTSAVLPWVEVAVEGARNLKAPVLTVAPTPPVSCNELSDAHYPTPTLGQLDVRCATEPTPVARLESEAEEVTCFTATVTRVWTVTDSCQQTARLTQVVPVTASPPVFAYVPGDVLLPDTDPAVREAGVGALPSAALLPGGAAREGDHCGPAVTVRSWDVAVPALDCRRMERRWTVAYTVPAQCAGEAVPVPTRQTQHITVCPESLFQAVTLQVAAAGPAADYLEPHPVHHGTEVDVVRKQMLGMYWRRVSTDDGRTWHYFDPTRRCYLQAVGDGAGGAALRCGDAAQAWTAHEDTSLNLVTALRVAVDGQEWSLVCTPQTPTCTVQRGQHSVHLAVVHRAELQVSDVNVTCSAYGSVIGSDTREAFEGVAAGNTVVPRPTFAATGGCTARVVLVAWAVEHQPCGRKEVRLTWRGQEAVAGSELSLQTTGIGSNCQRSTEERVQTIRVRPDVPAFAHVPRDVVVADAAGALSAWQAVNPAWLPGGAAHVAPVCGPRAVVQHHDTEWTRQASSTCWTMQRTWTAHLELDDQCGDSVHAPVEPVQRVTVCSSSAGAPEVTFAAAGGAPVLRVGEKNNVDGLERVVSLNGSSGAAAAVWVEHAVTATESYFHNHQHGCFLNYAPHCKGYSAAQPTCSGGPTAQVAVCVAEPRLWRKVAVPVAPEMVGAPAGTSFHYLVTGSSPSIVGPTGFVLATHRTDATLLEALPVPTGTLSGLTLAGGEYFRMVAVGVFGGSDLAAKPQACTTDGDCGAAWFCRSVDTGAAVAVVGTVVLPTPGSPACGATRLLLGESCVGREGCCATGSACTAVNGYATCQFAGRVGCSQFAGVGESCAGAAAGCCTPGTHCVVTATAGTAVCQVSTCSSSRRVCVRRSGVGELCGAGAAGGGCGEQRCADGLVCDAKAKTCAAPAADTMVFSAVAVEQVSAQRPCEAAAASREAQALVSDQQAPTPTPMPLPPGFPEFCAFLSCAHGCSLEPLEVIEELVHTISCTRWLSFPPPPSFLRVPLPCRVRVGETTQGPCNGGVNGGYCTRSGTCTLRQRVKTYSARCVCPVATPEPTPAPTPSPTPAPTPAPVPAQCVKACPGGCAGDVVEVDDDIVHTVDCTGLFGFAYAISVDCQRLIGSPTADGPCVLTRPHELSGRCTGIGKCELRQRRMKYKMQCAQPRQMAEASVARLSGGQTVFVWADHGAQGGASAGVFGQLYSHAFAPVGVEFQVSAGGADQPQVAALYGGGFVVVWASTGAGGAVHAQVFTSSGERGGEAVSVATGVAAALTATAPQPRVAGFADRGGFVVSWHQQQPQPQVRFADFDENMAAVRAASGTVSTGNVAMASFQHSLGFALAHTGPSGEALVELFDGNAAAVAKRAVCGVGGAVWDMAKYPYDHRLAVLCRAAGGAVSLEILGGDGEVVVAAQHVAAALAVDEAARGRARVAVLSDETVAVVWAGPQGVAARHFSAAADAAPLGGEIAVHSGAATRPAVAALRDGGFVAAFTTAGLGRAAGAIGASFLHHADVLPTVGEAAESVDAFLVGADGLSLVHDDALDMVRMLPHSADRGVWTLHAVLGGTVVYNAKRDCYLSMKTLPPGQCLGGYCDIATCTPRGSAALLQARPHLWTLVDVAPAVPGVRGRKVRLLNAERHVDVYTAAAAAAYGNPQAEPRFVALVAGGSVAGGRNVLEIDVVINKAVL